MVFVNTRNSPSPIALVSIFYLNDLKKQRVLQMNVVKVSRGAPTETQR